MPSSATSTAAQCLTGTRLSRFQFQTCCVETPTRRPTSATPILSTALRNLLIAADYTHSVYWRKCDMCDGQKRRVGNIHRMKRTVIEYILEEAKKHGLDQKKFAERIGVEPQAVTNWVTRGIPFAQIPRAAAIIGQSVDDVLKCGVGMGRSPWQVPIISYVRAGAWDEAHDPLQPGDSEGMAYTTQDVGENGYALRVRDDSMTASTGKTFPEGSIVIVHPGKRDPHDRQFVIAKLKGRDAVTFKQFRRDDIGRIWLQPLNPGHAPIHEEFEVIGTVVQKVEDV